MPTIHQVKMNIVAASTSLIHSGLIADTLISSIERRFAHLFAFDNDTKMYAVAAVSHPNFKLRWVPSERKQWVKEAFIDEVIKHHSTTGVGGVNVTQSGHSGATTTGDNFFDFDDDSASAGTAENSNVTIECLRYLEDGPSPVLNVLDSYPTVKSLFRTINATLPSSAPVERLFSKGALIANQ